MVDIKVPMFPDSIAEGTIAVIHKSLGDVVNEGDLIAEVETDKIMMEVLAISPGIVSEIKKQEGDTVVSEEIILILSEINAESSNTEIDTNVTKNNITDDTLNSDSTKNKVLNIDRNSDTNRYLSPTGRRFSKFTLNSKDNLFKEDTVSNKSHNITNGVAVNKIIVTDDKRAEKRVRMTRLRQTIAKRLLDVQHNNAILSTFNEVDMNEVINIRNKYKNLFKDTYNIKLGFMSFFLKASTEALKAFPELNASIEGNEIVYHEYFDLGVAVSSDRGLVVPVMRNIDQKSFFEIENELLQKALKARDGKLSLEEMQGGTFTVTNGGTFGSMLSTPIINAPQSAILGMHNIVKRPVVVDNNVVIRPIMYLALSYDHRIVDGSMSVRFLKKIKDLIEDPSRLLLNI